MKQIIQIETELRFPSYGRQTSQLFYERGRTFELGTIENKSS